MSYETEILTERIDKLENHIMELNQSIKEQKKHSEVEINVFVSFFLFLFPVSVLIFVLLSLDVNYQTEKH